MRVFLVRGAFELAKDLMSMANKLGPYAAPAYILIGVKEIDSEKTGEIVGVDAAQHLDDAKMQEKVKHLLNKEERFSQLLSRAKRREPSRSSVLIR